VEFYREFRGGFSAESFSVLAWEIQPDESDRDGAVASGKHNDVISGKFALGPGPGHLPTNPGEQEEPPAIWPIGQWK
jgi:hypothetical protein